LSKPKSKEDDSDAPQLLFSPTLRYVGGQHLSPSVKFVDKKTGRTFQGQVAFQLEVHPGSYKIGPPSAPLLHPGMLRRSSRPYKEREREIIKVLKTNLTWGKTHA
jgi:hypothetical protein